MPYMNYNLPMQRTGFRPYGHTNPWSATQLNGVSSHGQWPFTEDGGWRLGQIQRGLSPHFLDRHGLGQADACADASGEFVSCTDAGCVSGPCGTTLLPSGCSPGFDYDPGSMTCVPHQKPPGTLPSGCSPGYTYDPGSMSCIPAVALPPGPSPRVPAGPGNFPWTAPTIPPPATTAAIYPHPSTTSAWSGITPYLPLILLAGFGLALLGGRR
jgi:hypothetical protein